MRKTFTALCLAAAASWMMTVSAQSGATASTQGETQKSSKAKSMTFTGCVQEGDTPGTYKLTNISTAGSTTGTGAHGTGTSGTGTTGSGTTGSGTAGSGMSGQSGSGMSAMDNMELVASGDVNLKNHVGHKVQVTGTMDMSGKQSGTSGSGTGTAGSGTSGSGTTGSGTTGSGTTMSGQSGQHGMTGDHKFKVRSVKMISETCSGQ